MAIESPSFYLQPASGKKVSWGNDKKIRRQMKKRIERRFQRRYEKKIIQEQLFEYEEHIFIAYKESFE